MRANRDMDRMRHTMRSTLFSFASFALLVVAGACGELTGPESPSTPSDVVATLVSATSATVTWTPSPLNDGVISYSIFRNGEKVGESPTNTFTDTGLTPQTTYVYSVAANCESGIVSARSVETEQSTVTTVDVTAPAVIATSPVNGATGVSRAGTSTVTFSEPMDPATINTTTFNIRVTSTGAILPGTVTYTPATRVAEYIPSSALPNATNLTVTVTTGAKDLAGNALAAPFTVAWTTRDEEGPLVTATFPANGATGVPANSLLRVTFNEPVDATTVNGTSITLRVTSSGALVPATVTYNPDTRTATLTPSALLSENVAYTMTINGVRDPAGNVMPAPVQVSFTVQASPPVVTSITPSPGATGVAVNTTVQITFSEAMDPATITTTNIFLRNAATGALVPATVTYNAATSVATLTPSSPLSGTTSYITTITTGVRDLAGNPMAQNAEFVFTTVDTVAPTVVTTVPADDATGVAVNSTVQVIFNEAMDASTINAANITLRNTVTSAPVAATVT